MGYVDCEYQLMGVETQLWGRFHSVCIDCDGPVALGEAGLEALRGLAFDPRAYGRKLFDHLFPSDSDLLKGYLENRAFLTGKAESLRFRLYLAPGITDGVRRLDWERLHDGDGVLAYSSTIAFSRYLAIRAPLGVALAGRPRLLVAIAAPLDQQRLGLAPIDRERTRGDLERCFRTHLDGRIEYEFLAGPVTPGALLRRLQEKRFHALHLVAHGLPPGRKAAGLTLEDDKGLALLVPEEDVSTIFSGNAELRLITLLACHGSASVPGDPYHGLAGRLVRTGVPAVVAMSREISFKAAALFSQHFYPSLAESEQVDVAVNAARRHLSIASDEWDVPVLFLRLRDARLWSLPEIVQGQPGAENRKETQKERRVPEGPSGPGSLPAGLWRPRRIVIVSFLTVLLLGTAVGLWILRPSSGSQTGEVIPGTVVSANGGQLTTEATSPPPKQPGSEGHALSQPGGDFSACQALREASAYKKAGGGNLERSAETYQRIVSELSPADRTSLDSDLLARAEEQRGRGSTSEAVRLYQEYLAGLGCSGPNTQSPTQ